MLSLCHTVQVDETAEEKYQASSPDEFSLIKFCARVGVVFEGDAKDPLDSGYMLRCVSYKDTMYKYQLLNVLEFDADRKRMSVIVRDLQDNRIMLLAKGAESSIFKICTSGDLDVADADIKSYAHNGWRTLAIAFKYMSESEYAQVDSMIKAAYNDIVHRKEELSRVYAEVEARLELIGSTAVEDKLQEDVADTLEKLRKGGIKIWVLTGDKTETAINISQSCKHFSDSMIKLKLTELKEPNDVKHRLRLFQKQ